MTTVLRATNYTLDVDLLLEDGAAAITADGAGSEILDMGANGSRMRGDIVVDVSAIDETTGDEQYTIIAELSDSSTHASGIEPTVALLLGGATTPLGNRDIESDIGRYILPFTNQANGRTYRFLQLHVDVTGTTPSITFVAHLAIAKGL